MPVDFVLDDRPDKCWVERHQIQLCRAKFDEVGMIWGSSPSVRGPHLTWVLGCAWVHRWISTCDVAKELETCGTDDASECSSGDTLKLLKYWRYTDCVTNNQYSNHSDRTSISALFWRQIPYNTKETRPTWDTFITNNTKLRCINVTSRNIWNASDKSIFERWGERLYVQIKVGKHYIRTINHCWQWSVQLHQSNLRFSSWLYPTHRHAQTYTMTQNDTDVAH